MKSRGYIISGTELSRAWSGRAHIQSRRLNVKVIRVRPAEPDEPASEIR
jgi:hypothetical protein